MAPPPAAATADTPGVPAHPVVEAVELVLRALHSLHADRVLLSTGRTPQVFTGPRRHTSGVPLTLPMLERIVEGLFPPAYIDALEEIGATRLRVPGFAIDAAYNGSDLMVEISRVRY